jgi:hypothetical protein
MSDVIVGQIFKVYTAYPAEYFRVFFTDESIIVTRYASFTSPFLEGVIIDAFRALKERKKIEKQVSKQQILSEMKHAEEIHKNQIQEIRLRKQLTDVSIEIELPSTKGFLGKKRNIKKFGFSKKEYEDVAHLLFTYFPDKFKR